MAAKKNEQHPLRIEGYGSAGEGVARLEGQAVFVKGALAGEICQVQLLKVGKSAAWGRVTQVLTPVPGRQSPDCPRYPRCGGCQLRHMTYAEELRFKLRIFFQLSNNFVPGFRRHFNRVQRRSTSLILQCCRTTIPELLNVKY